MNIHPFYLGASIYAKTANKNTCAFMSIIDMHIAFDGNPIQTVPPPQAINLSFMNAVSVAYLLEYQPINFLIFHFSRLRQIPIYGKVSSN